MASKSTITVDYENWCEFEFEEQFTFSANGKSVYLKRIFDNGQELYWMYDAEGYPLDEGHPSSARAYAAANRSNRK